MEDDGLTPNNNKRVLNSNSNLIDNFINFTIEHKYETHKTLKKIFIQSDEYFI